MRVTVVGEYRLFRDPTGSYYAESVFGYEFWRRYLEVFQEVVVAARVARVDKCEGFIRVDGPSVRVWEMPYYIGPMEYMRKSHTLRRSAKRLASEPGAFILRVPGPIGTLVARSLERLGRPYAVEVVGDPADVFQPGVISHPLRRFMRIRSVGSLRTLCKRAVAVAYVSKLRLANRYPAGSGVPTFAYSSASLPAEAYRASARRYTDTLSRLVAIGSMEQLYKGFDILLRTLPELRRRHPEMKLTLVGGGRYEANLRNLARELGCAELVTFRGILHRHSDVLQELDKADLLVSASRTEGLPRTVLEAHARGLPSVGTDVGATADLVSKEFLCAPGDVQALTDVIWHAMSNPEGATAEASRGWKNSHLYSSRELQARRNSMFAVIYEAVSDV